MLCSPSISCAMPFVSWTRDVSRPHFPPAQPVSLAALSISLLRLRAVHAANITLSKSNTPKGTPTPTPILVASDLEWTAGVAVTVVAAVVLVPQLSLTVVAANVTGANGLPKTLPKVASQQLTFSWSEQQNSPLKLPELPQGTAETALEVPTKMERTIGDQHDFEISITLTSPSTISGTKAKSPLTHHSSIHWRNYPNSTTCPCKRPDTDSIKHRGSNRP